MCDAFKTKRYVYDPQRRMFDETVAPSKIECAGQSKIDLYRDRFLLLQQRLARSKQFERSTLRTTDRRGIELSSIQSLLGSRAERRFIAGSLSQLEDGRFHMEDLTGTVRVDLTACERSAGLFTENCVVIAEGEVRQDGVFEVIELMFPRERVAAARRRETRRTHWIFSAPGTFYDRTSWRSSRGRSKNVRVRCLSCCRTCGSINNARLID